MASMVMVLSMTMYCPGNAEASGADKVLIKLQIKMKLK